VGWRGDSAAAARAADEAMLIALQTGNESMRAVAFAHRAAALGSLGEVVRARADLEEARALSETTRYAQGTMWALATEGELALSLGDAAAAERAFAPLLAFVEASEIGEPFVVHFVPDAVETLIGVGQLPRAAALLDRYAARADALERRWAMAGVARCRSVLAAARGELDDASVAASTAVARWQELEMPVDLGRALLALGRIQRRRGERRSARDALARALGIFEGCSARLWAERAVEEMRRIPIRRGAPAELTATEERVAQLTAQGRTNREVAQALFMSPKTVQANLTRVYAKLGIHTRAELGARIAKRQRGGSEP
jgi:DNA-binding CsgD family transcriptional regulator